MAAAAAAESGRGGGNRTALVSSPVAFVSTLLSLSLFFPTEFLVGSEETIVWFGSVQVLCMRLIGGEGGSERQSVLERYCSGLSI